MSAPRALCCLAALMAVVTLGGCAATVSGHGSLAAGVPTPAASHGAEPTGSSGPSGTPGSSGTPRPTAGPTSTSSGGGKICPLFSAAELKKLFGEPVTTSIEADDLSCVFKTAGHGGVVVSVYDFLNLKEESARDPGGQTIRIAGHPAYQGKREILVARSSDPTAAGVIIAGNLFFDDEARGNTIAKKMLEKIVPKFGK